MSEKAQGSGNSAVFIGALVVALLSIVLAIYYIVPLNSHILVSSVAGSHYKPALAFGALAILCIIVALVARPKRATA